MVPLIIPRPKDFISDQNKSILLTADPDDVTAMLKEGSLTRGRSGEKLGYTATRIISVLAQRSDSLLPDLIAEGNVLPDPRNKEFPLPSVAHFLLVDWYGRWGELIATGFENPERNNRQPSGVGLITDDGALRAAAFHKRINEQPLPQLSFLTWRQLPYTPQIMSATLGFDLLPNKGVKYWAKFGEGSTTTDPQKQAEAKHALNLDEYFVHVLFPGLLKETY
jgi:hypothetical protein